MVATVLGILKVVAGFLITPQGIASVIGAAVAGYVLKRIDNKWVYKPIYGACYSLGCIITLGLSKWAITKVIWNKTIEPFVVDLLENILNAVKDGLLGGLHSDNK